MIKHIPFALILLLTVTTGCGIKEVIPPPSSNTNVSGVSSSNSYQPVSEGSTWVYNNSVIGGTTVQSTIKMTGGTTKFAGKTYYNASSISTGQAASNGYFYNDSNVYIVRSSSSAAPGLVVNMEYLDTRLPVGGTWTTPATDGGIINGVPAQMVGTIMETGINKTIGNKTFNNVIHTQIDLQYDYGSGFQSFMLYDYYVAKGVGMIEQDSKSFGIDVNKQTIVSYTVK